ncbi:MAG: hypothetical protein LBC18_00330 [Opitutaceae bacterium]|jgi:hypothetical protein|nr:hypothetical protein [Opitutaceae bacterium]
MENNTQTTGPDEGMAAPVHAALVRNDFGGLEMRFFMSAADAARARATRPNTGVPKVTPQEAQARWSPPALVEVTGTTSIEPMVCNAAVARRILGNIGVTTLWALEKRGVVKRLPDFPRSMYSVAHLREVVERQMKKAAV